MKCLLVHLKHYVLNGLSLQSAKYFRKLYGFNINQLLEIILTLDDFTHTNMKQILRTLIAVYLKNRWLLQILQRMIRSNRSKFSIKPSVTDRVLFATSEVDVFRDLDGRVVILRWHKTKHHLGCSTPCLSLAPPLLLCGIVHLLILIL